MKCQAFPFVLLLKITKDLQGFFFVFGCEKSKTDFSDSIKSDKRKDMEHDNTGENRQRPHVIVAGRRTAGPP